MEMNFPILDEAANEDDETCTNLLKRSTVWSYSTGSTTGLAKPEDTPCEKGKPVGNITCVCKKMVSHFTTFTVADAPAEDASPDRSPLATAPNESSGGLSTGAIT